MQQVKEFLAGLVMIPVFLFVALIEKIKGVKDPMDFS